MNTKKIIRLLTFSLWVLGGYFLTSCEKEIELDLNKANKKFVIEGQITANEVAIIKITKTVDFTESNEFPAVSGAVVSLSNGTGKTEQLRETSAGIYESKEIKGEEGKTFTLNVSSEGNTFTAVSTMPKNVKLSGARVEKSSFAPPGGGGSGAQTYIVYPQFIDPTPFGNNYRFIQATKSKVDKTIIVANDNIGNGLPNSRPLLSRGLEIVEGDNVTIQMECIDKPIYDYFFSLASLAGNGPGGGTVPANPVTNIKGGALGYFSAHTVQKMTVEVK
jgi:hypothetical protein